MVRTLYLQIAYDGTDFHGWQTQEGVRTVQNVLENTLRRVVRHDLQLIGSGRTDAGVHATGQVASFTTSCTVPTDRLRHAIGSRLDSDLAILAVHDVHPAFHAQRDAMGKLYRYRIHHSQTRPVMRMTQRYACHVWHALDVERMREASGYFIGTMDFRAVCHEPLARRSTVRTVLRCDVERHLDEIHVDVAGTGFLYHQVRAMVGALLTVGMGRRPPEWVAEILASGRRDTACPTAPARGLCLCWVRYPPHRLRPAAPHDQDASSTAPSTMDIV